MTDRSALAGCLCGHVGGGVDLLGELLDLHLEALVHGVQHRTVLEVGGTS